MVEVSVLMDDIDALTDAYLARPDGIIKLKDCARSLACNASLQIS